MKAPHTLILTIVALFAIIIPSFVLAVEPERYISIAFEKGTANYKLEVIENSLYYQPSFFRGAVPEKADLIMKFFDTENNYLSELPVYIDENNYLPFNSRIAKVVLQKDSLVISEKIISFCNNNGICEPCEGYDCTLVENSLACADCQSGSADNFCDLVNDGICDPDCNNHDKDCAACTQNCWYRDSILPTTKCAEDKKGVICAPGQSCTGKYVYADDSGSLCCTNGSCVSDIQQPTSPQSGNTTAPSEKTAPSPDNKQPSLLILLGIMSAALLIIVISFLMRKHRP